MLYSLHEASHIITLHHFNQPLKSFLSTTLVENCTLYNEFNKFGYALPKRTKTRFIEAQQQFVYKEFQRGEYSGKKVKLEAFVLKMRSCQDENNIDNKIFTPKEYLTKEQISSIFSRLA